MKEQILHLDPHDDYHSARDKMGWTQTQRVLLVWPTRGRALTRQIDLLLLHRHAFRLGAHLAIITADPEMRTHARTLGLPVFDSIAASRRTRWRSRPLRLAPERRQSSPSARLLKPPASPLERLNVPLWLSWLIKSLFFAAGVAALVLLAYALIPSAVITLAPAPRLLHLTLNITADPALETIEGLTIPARPVLAEVEASGHLPTTGLKDVPGETATGTVVFTNLAGVAAAIPKGLSLRTTSGQAIRFVTLQAADLPARFNATAEVSVRAVDPGPAGNVGAGQINAIDGPLGLQLAVINPTATGGGTVTQRYAVAETDRDQLRAQLLEQLQFTARETIAAQLQPGEFLADDSVALARVAAETYSHSVGEATDILTLTLRLSATALRLSDADARLAAQNALAAAVPDTETLLPQATSIERNPITYLDTAGRVHFDLTVTGSAVPIIDSARVRQALTGQTVSAALAYLTDSLPLAAPPTIVVAPAGYAQWYNRLPWLEYRVRVVIQSQ